MKSLPPPTAEQLAVVDLVPGVSAVVSAGPGTGKSTTVASLIRKRVIHHGVAPDAIATLTYNRRAADELNTKLASIPKGKRPKATTFHGFAERIIRRAIAIDVRPQAMFVRDEGQLRALVAEAIRAVEDAGHVERHSVAADDVLDAIRFYKAHLIPPEYAAHTTRPELVAIYAEFERIRRGRHILTFDDYDGEVIDLLSANPALREEVLNPLRLVVIDEAQDMSPARFGVLRVLADSSADLVLVGDGCQAVNRWVGATPAYLLGEAEARITRNWVRLQLTLTHRFGPRLALPAARIMRRIRASSTITASGPTKTSAVVHGGEDPAQVNRALIDAIVAEVSAGRNASEVAVLVRSHTQASPLCMQMLLRGVPFRVEGESSLFAHPIVRATLAYVRCALGMAGPARARVDDVVTAINVPSRRVKQRPLRETMATHGGSLAAALGALVSRPPHSIAYAERELASFARLLNDAHGRMGVMPVGAVVEWIVEHAEIRAHIKNMHGRGRPDDVHGAVLDGFIAFAKAFPDQDDIGGFLATCESPDTTQGADDEDCILVTTIHRTKGAEWAVVVVPDCVEGLMPLLLDEDDGPHDRRRRAQRTHHAEDEERCLFFVAITRAKDLLLVGAPDDGERIRPSRFIDESGLAWFCAAFDDIEQPGFIEDARRRGAPIDVLKAVVDVGGCTATVAAALHRRLQAALSTPTPMRGALPAAWKAVL